jgi:hypothetical protein
MKTLCSLCVLLFTLGCATTPTGNTKVWYQPGKTEAQLRQDWAESQLAAQHALVNNRGPQPIITDNSAAASYAAGAGIAANRDARNDARRLAPLTMQSRGYQLVPLSTVPSGEAYLRP